MAPSALGAQYTTTGTSFKDSILLGGGQSAERFPDGKNFALALPKSIAVSSLGGVLYKKYLMDKQVDTDTYPIRYGAYVWRREESCDTRHDTSRGDPRAR